MLPSTATFLCGGAAGLTAQIISYPLDLLRTRFAAQGVPKVLFLFFFLLSLSLLNCLYTLYTIF
jgi:hypothetical protein